MVKLEVLKAAVNCVILGVDLQGNRGVRIYRARRASGPYEEVGVAYGERYVDGADLEPGRRYFYCAVVWNSPYLYPEPGWWKEGGAGFCGCSTGAEGEAGHADAEAAGVYCEYGRVPGRVEYGDGSSRRRTLPDRAGVCRPTSRRLSRTCMWRLRTWGRQMW